MERLHRQLRKIGVIVEGLPVKTRPTGGPPCFRHTETSYKDWLAQASISYETVPYRLSMPAEPNYCRDCIAPFKAEMQGIGACIFPEVKFEPTKEFGESVVVGICRAPEVDPVTYGVYADLTDKRRG